MHGLHSSKLISSLTFLVFISHPNAVTTKLTFVLSCHRSLKKNFILHININNKLLIHRIKPMNRDCNHPIYFNLRIASSSTKKPEYALKHICPQGALPLSESILAFSFPTRIELCFMAPHFGKKNRQPLL